MSESDVESGSTSSEALRARAVEEWHAWRNAAISSDGATLLLEFAEAAVAAERARCASLCDGWLAIYGDRDIKYTSARDYATDAVKDIRDTIRSGAEPPAEITEPHSAA